MQQNEKAERFGQYLRAEREMRQSQDGAAYSLRQVADRVAVGSAYLSQVERGQASLPTEEKLLLLAADLKLDPNVVLAMAGRVSSELQAIILKRPQLFAQMLAACRDLPDTAILTIVREVRDGSW